MDNALKPLLRSSPIIPTFDGHPALRMVRQHRSSPAERFVQDRCPTPGFVDKPMWDSQPALQDTTNVHHRNSSEISPRDSRVIHHERLMSAREPPTPKPLARVPESKTSPSTRDTAPMQMPYQSPRSKAKSQIVLGNDSPQHPVSESKASAYWSGRLSSLIDSFRNEDLAAHLLLISKTGKITPRPKTETDHLQSVEASTARYRRAFRVLLLSCVTKDAKQTLLDFRKALARTVGLELSDLMDDAENAESSRPAGSTGNDADNRSVQASLNESRKASLMGRLFGRSRKSVVD